MKMANVSPAAVKKVKLVMMVITVMVPVYHRVTAKMILPPHTQGKIAKIGWWNGAMPIIQMLVSAAATIWLVTVHVSLVAVQLVKRAMMG